MRVWDNAGKGDASRGDADKGDADRADQGEAGRADRIAAQKQLRAWIQGGPSRLTCFSVIPSIVGLGSGFRVQFILNERDGLCGVYQQVHNSSWSEI